MIRHNAQLRYAMKRKVGEEDEAVKLLQLSKEGAESETHSPEEEGLIVAEYESDDEATPKSSRTHSQLAQFVHEVQKSPYGAAVRLVNLGSRQNLCINPEVVRLGNVQMMNDRCLEMQKNKHEKREKASDSETKRRRGVPKATCPFSGFENLMAMRDEVLVKVRDVEQLLQHGRETHTCPYYSTRMAIPAAQVVVLPYQSLLHASTRKASRLKAKNLMYIKQILFVLEGLVRTLGEKQCGFDLLDVSEQQVAVEDKPIMASPMMLVESFLFALTKQQKMDECDTKTGLSSLKFLLLNAAVHFAQIVQECRAVIIAGGTMQPVS
ncbi:hypothetical protein QQF64_003149 [Cirrhinus molitorella]|uniref:Helicase ATP-binding domain-containing protein n=1 Tax=Cirrhinus molitorella TaxID=172907 RepID=A0ABR3MKU2_9TELE